MIALAATDASPMPYASRDEAAAHVARIKGHWQAFWFELKEFHDRRGWEALGYRSWDACVREELGFTRQRAHQLITGAVVVAILQSSNSLDPEDPYDHAQVAQIERHLADQVVLPCVEPTRLPVLSEEQRRALLRPYPTESEQSTLINPNTSTIVDVPLPNEAQARELAALRHDPDAVRAVWRNAQEAAPTGSDGQPMVTATLIRDLAARVIAEVGDPWADEAAATPATPELEPIPIEPGGPVTVEQAITAIEHLSLWYRVRPVEVADALTESQRDSLLIARDWLSAVAVAAGLEED